MPIIGSWSRLSAKIGRYDLVEVIRHKSAEFRNEPIWLEDQGWKPTVKRVDLVPIWVAATKKRGAFRFVIPHLP